MNKIFTGSLILTTAMLLFLQRVDAQKIDSIYFHLYTDSLKMEVQNYINVDAKMSDGRWRPLTDKELIFKSSYGKWIGNNLVIDSLFKGEFVEVTATLKTDTLLTRKVVIYMKKDLTEPVLKTVDEIWEPVKNKRKKLDFYSLSNSYSLEREE